MMVSKPNSEEVNLMLGTLNKKKSLIKKRSERNKIGPIISMQLPKEKNLRIKILKNIFKFLSPLETIICSLVNR
jgi:hypothetical protein